MREVIRDGEEVAALDGEEEAELDGAGVAGGFPPNELYCCPMTVKAEASLDKVELSTCKCICGYDDTGESHESVEQ